MKSEEIFVGDHGTHIGLTILDSGQMVDLSGATAKTINFRKPDGTILSETASFENDGTDGKIYVASDSSWLNQKGEWAKQAVVTISGKTFHSDIVTFNVNEVLS